MATVKRMDGCKTKSNHVVFTRRRSDIGRGKVGRLRGDLHLDVAAMREVSMVVKMEVCKHPSRDPFKILRFLVLIFFAA